MSIWSERGARVAPFAVFFVTTALLFGSVLTKPDRVVGSERCDAVPIFIPLRDYSFTQLRKGTMPLWNPHVFSGVPHLAGFQSGLYYPFNWLHLVMSPAAGLNWNNAIHLFLAGCFMYWWSRRRETSRYGATIAGLSYMYGAPFFLHIYAGHIIHNQAMTWIPLVFLATDALAGGGVWTWALLGSAAVAMQILSGSPQYVYYTALCAGGYALFLSIRNPYRGRILAGYGGMYLFSVALAAAQFLPSLAASDELLRSSGLPYQRASSFSFHPQNFATLIAPFALGTPEASFDRLPGDSNYFGAGNHWEECLYIGVVALSLAVWGLATVRKPGTWAGIGTIILAGLLMMGVHTPLYDGLFHYLPKFNHFRATAKFCIIFALFLSLFAGFGLDALTATALRNPRAVVRYGLGLAIIGALILIAADSVTDSSGNPSETWADVLMSIRDTKDLHPPTPPPGTFTDPEFVRNTAIYTSRSLSSAGVFVAIVGVLWLGFRYFPFRGLIVGCVAVEAGIFAWVMLPTAEAQNLFPSKFVDDMQNRFSDSRLIVLNAHTMNAVMTHQLFGFWGNDPIVIKRYAEFMSFTQGIDPENATQDLQLREKWPFETIYPMLRCRFLCWSTNGKFAARLMKNPLPQAVVVYDYEMVKDRDQAFRLMADPGFDPRKRVFLEDTPVPPPSSAGRGGDVRVRHPDVNSIEFEVELAQPGILLVTDVYSKDWTARPVEPGPQNEYRVMPANYCLRAVPLAAGRHHFVMEYRPSAVVLGRWVSALAWVFLIVSASLSILRHTRATGKTASDPKLSQEGKLTHS